MESLAFGPDGSWLVSASRDDTVRLWSLGVDGNQPKEIAKLSYKDLECSRLHVFSDGRILVFRKEYLEIWHELRELLVRIRVSFTFDTIWHISDDEQRIAITFREQMIGIWSLQDGRFLGRMMADISRPDSLFNVSLLQQVKPSVGAEVWRGPGGPYLYIGDGPRSWARPLSLSPDRTETVVSCAEGAALISIELEPQLIQFMPFNKRLRASAITDERVVLLNDDGEVFHNLRNSADGGGS